MSAEIKLFPQETLWWPIVNNRPPIGEDGRLTAEAWLPDLKRIGLLPGHMILFTCETVTSRFDLTIDENGGYRTDPDLVVIRNGERVVSQDGHCTTDVGDLVYWCDDENQSFPERYPLKYSCRVVAAKNIRMFLDVLNGEPHFAIGEILQ
jgi:hypothetical protein